MFMIARQGTRAFAIRPISSRTPGEPYWASCMPSTTRSNAAGSTPSGVVADSWPGSFVEATSMSRPLTENFTTVPSRLISSAVDRVHTSATLCPAISSLVPNSDPYDAPRISTR